MVPTMLVFSCAWNLSVAVADLNTYIADHSTLLESGALRSQTYRNGCLCGFGARHTQ
ncbi:hypothetical protein VHARVF571_190063 [Vibrio harveyi]|nr:hypothetical protein VHARVF571_190063 [Vibrio harveyi]